jgi:MFS transporter, ACS family, hexuronate transporter
LIITVLTAISSVILAFIPNVSFWTMVPIVVIFGFCVSGFNGIWMNLASELVPREQAGISSGISITLGSIGAVFIPPIYGYTVDQTSSFTFGWLLITGMMVAVLSMLSYLAMVIKRKTL